MTVDITTAATLGIEVDSDDLTITEQDNGADDSWDCPGHAGYISFRAEVDLIDEDATKIGTAALDFSCNLDGGNVQLVDVVRSDIRGVSAVDLHDLLDIEQAVWAVDASALVND